MPAFRYRSRSHLTTRGVPALSPKTTRGISIVLISVDLRGTLVKTGEWLASLQRRPAHVLVFLLNE